MAILQAKPEPVEIDLARTALIVVDMQNAFASKGGMLDLFGLDITGADIVASQNAKLLRAAREAKLKIVYLQIGYRPDFADAGGPGSPNPLKELGLVLMRKRPELQGKVLTEGTWDFDIVDELKPRPDDVVLKKTRYSGFAGTPLDSILRTSGIKYLLFTGIATNVCVESTLRDAYFLEYWPILISDACLQAGPAFIQEATVFNVTSFFGWVSTTDEIVKSLMG